MKTTLATIALVALCIVGIFVWQPRAATPDTRSSVVKVMVGSGHGSGVYIGSGIVLTAAHVLAGAADSTVRIKTEGKNLLDGEVLWINKARDVGAIRVATTTGLKAAFLSCIDPQMGDQITARGNPGFAEFFTSWGHVSDAIKHEIGPWAQALIVDASISPGQSGGPVFDSAGRVVGLAVGVMLAPLSQGATSLSGVGIIVPGSAVCELLGRA